MRLSKLSDSDLLSETQRVVSEERTALTIVLEHLREIDRRRLFSALGYSSLFSYAVKKLGYAEDQAYRRISAMHLLKEFPEIESKINAGSLSLTNLGLAKTAFRKMDCEKKQKLEILQSLENQSTRQTEKILAQLIPESPKKDSIRACSETEIHLSFSADAALREKMDSIKGLLAHKHPHLSLGELFHLLCDLGLETWSKSAKTAAPRDLLRRSQSKASARKVVWKEAKGRCEICNSQYALEIDHRVPRGRGGSEDRENLRLLCRNCNQRAAIEMYGQEKMQRYIRA